MQIASVWNVHSINGLICFDIRWTLQLHINIRHGKPMNHRLCVIQILFLLISSNSKNVRTRIRSYKILPFKGLTSDQNGHGTDMDVAKRSGKKGRRFLSTVLRSCILLALHFYYLLRILTYLLLLL